MLGWLHDFVASFVCLVKSAIIGALNLITGAIEAVAQAAINALPNVPAPPDFASATLPGGTQLGTVLGWVNYGFPVGTLIAALTTASGIVLAVYVANIALRWARAVE